MAHTNPEIRAALEAQLSSVSGLPEVVWTDDPRDPNTQTPYIRGTFLVQTKRPVDTVLKIARGQFQLDVLYPLAQDAAGEAMAAAIEAAFPMTGMGIVLADGFTCVEFAQAQNGVPDGGWWRIPVVISWSHYYS